MTALPQYEARARVIYFVFFFFFFFFAIVCSLVFVLSRRQVEF